MLTLAPHVARLDHAWQAVRCFSCNAEVGEPCKLSHHVLHRNGVHMARIDYAEALGFRETAQHELAFSQPRRSVTT